MTNYFQLCIEAKRAITILPYGNKFYLRDLIDNPPSGIGIWLYKEVYNKTIPEVIYLGKDSQKTNIYKKVNRQ